MKDPIDRNATVDAIKSGYIDDTSDVECPEECNAMLDWAIETIEGMPSEELDTDRIYSELSKVYNIKGLPDEAIDIIGDLMLSLELPSTQQEQHWIPCSSGKFPKESGTYTVTAYDGATNRVTYAKYQKRLKRWELTGARAYWRVLAWMPLPEPYREGKE